MNASLGDLIFYAFGISLLLITPGPVCIAIVARSLINGVRGAWLQGFGVTLRDILWPLTAMLGLSCIAGESGGYLFYLKWLAALIFFIKSIGLLRRADTLPSENKADTAPSVLSDFIRRNRYFK